MGKQLISYEPKHHHQSRNHLNVMHKNLKKSSSVVKVTYISSPVLVRACDASEFRSVVQQLTGKDSNDDSILPHNRHQIQDPPTCRVIQGGGGGPLASTATTTNSIDDAEDHGNYYASSHNYNYNNNTSMEYPPLEFQEDYYFWKDVARSVPLSSYLIA